VSHLRSSSISPSRSSSGDSGRRTPPRCTGGMSNRLCLGRVGGHKFSRSPRLTARPRRAARDVNRASCCRMDSDSTAASISESVFMGDEINRLIPQDGRHRVTQAVHAGLPVANAGSTVMRESRFVFKTILFYSHNLPMPSRGSSCSLQNLLSLSAESWRYIHRIMVNLQKAAAGPLPARVDTMRESSGNWTVCGIRGSASDRPG